MKKKAIAFSDIPAPYRIGVFEELAKEYDMTVFFNQYIDQERNMDYIIKDSAIKYFTLDNLDGKNEFNKCLRRIKEYKFVLAYHIGLANGLRLMFVGLMHNLPCFVNNDGAFINKNLWKNAIKRFMIKRAALCFGSGETSRKYFLTFGAKEENIRYHHFTSLNDEDIIKQAISNNERRQLRERLGLNDKKTVISVGQFIYRKGFDVLLESWRHIQGNHQLVIIGGGSLEYNYLEFIKSNQIKNVEIIGFKSKKILFDYYKASDLFVLPTRKDTWGLVVNEAMACGLPVITTEMCNAGIELIENGINGYIVPIDDVNVLAQKMQEILCNDALTKLMSDNNILKIQGQTIKNIAECHIKDITQYFLNTN